MAPRLATNTEMASSGAANRSHGKEFFSEARNGKLGVEASECISTKTRMELQINRKTPPGLLAFGACRHGAGVGTLLYQTWPIISAARQLADGIAHHQFDVSEICRPTPC
ncbi:MAG TPA: hypothetical protein VLC92_18000 [Rhodocyclaceae bacterium]|nr:hypothetical protein [Rhodocyclaceae bacterium]